MSALAVVIVQLVLLGQVDAGVPCGAREHRQFDFWLGRWDVTTPDGKPAGTNEITSELGGCVLHEHWSGARGGKGESFNVYDASRKRWHQSWVDDHGALLLIEGGFSGGKMILTSTGGSPTNRITYEVLAGGRVRQLWESSVDGHRWTVVFDGTYVKHAG